MLVQSVAHASETFAIESVSHPSGNNMKHLHCHQTYELYFLEQGQHGYLLNDKYIQLYPQDVVLLKPNILHKNHNTKSYTRTCVYFTETFLQSYYSAKAQGYLTKCFQTDVISLDTENFFKAQRLLEKLKKEYAKNDFDGIFLNLGNLLVLLAQNVDSSRKDPPLYTMEKINPILNYITENYRDITHLDELTSRFHISTPHLCRAFKQNTGMTITNYINHVKIQHACELLTHTNKTITDIAQECGFNSSMYFCKIFKQQLGYTPSTFRQNIL